MLCSLWGHMRGRGWVGQAKTELGVNTIPSYHSPETEILHRKCTDSSLPVSVQIDAPVLHISAVFVSGRKRCEKWGQISLIATKSSLRFAGMFLQMKWPRGKGFHWNCWDFLLLLFCFVYKCSKTSWECTSDHNILICQLCSLDCFNQRVFDQNCSDTLSLHWQTPMQWSPQERCCSAQNLSASLSLLLSKNAV